MPLPRDVPIELELLVRHLAGETSPAEAEAVGRWAQTNRSHAASLAALRQVVGTGPEDAEPSDVAVLWRRVAPRLTAEPMVSLLDEQDATRARLAACTLRRPSGWKPRLIAAAALAAGVALVWWIPGFHSATPATPERPAQIVAAPRGQRIVFRLPDGTQVTLAPGTTLRAAPGYGARERVVQLEGEAAFTVRHDTAHPFVVRTAQADARDLGTRFVVRAYPDDSTTEVVVAEGEVALAGARLRAGQLGRAVPGHAVAVQSHVDLKRYLAWVDGRLVFHDTPLREVASRLARWYDVDIQFATGGLGALPLTAAFKADDSALDALRLVATTLDLHVSQVGRVYTLARK